MPAQIVEKSGEGLSRVYNITVPANDLVTKLEAKIAEIAPKMQLKGFRPGKVPPAHVKRMYGKDLMGEIVQETLTETNDKIFNDNNIRPAGQPELKAESDMDAVIAGKADLTYELAVELIPDFEVIDASKIKLSKPVYEPADAEVDEALTELAGQNKAYESRTGKSVKAKEDDQVVIDFIGRLDGEAFARRLLREKHVAVMPGSSFGEEARNFLRLSLTVPDDTLAEAVGRIADLGQELSGLAAKRA